MKNENTLLQLSVVPLGKADSDSVSPVVAKTVQKIRDSGLSTETHSMGTIIEGPLDDCMELIKNCLRDIAKESPRVIASIRIDFRPGHENRMKKNVASVEREIGE